MISYDKLRINFNPFDDALRPSNYSGYTNDPVPLTPLIGNRAYLSMAYTIERGTIAALADVNSPADKSRFGTNTNTTTGAKSRFEYYASMGVSPDGVSGGEGADTSGNPTYTSRMRSPFGNQDLLELLTYRGANDPSFTSTLESAAGGKYEGPSAMDQEQYLRYSPLRDNRPLALERLSVSARDASSYGTIEPRIYAHLAADVRKRLTTISGARPIRTAEIPVVQSTETNRYEVSADRLQASELKRPSSSVSASSSYQAYADGLAPYSADARAWPGTAEYAAHRFLNYGYRSPEVGLRMSAHMALNLETMRSSIAGEPPMLTVAIWRQMIGNLNGDLVSGLPKPWRDRQYKWSAWPYSSRRGALDASRLSATGADPMGMRVSADAVNVYGVTPQPFITAAASFSIYTDSKGTNDPADSKTYEIGFPTGAPEVEIQGDRTIANSDYLGEVFAVQVVNPFQQSITLGGEIKFTPSATDPNQAVWAATRTRFDYYLEY
ncbi:MAG TPA: hypothetical protein PKU91_08560, partial [Phycisphaerales bacterium]|nr:hypothetical protein [Phycisphaerales bacterium]